MSCPKLMGRVLSSYPSFSRGYLIKLASTRWYLYSQTVRSLRLRSPDSFCKRLSQMFQLLLKSRISDCKPIQVVGPPSSTPKTISSPAQLQLKALNLGSLRISLNRSKFFSGTTSTTTNMNPSKLKPIRRPPVLIYVDELHQFGTSCTKIFAMLRSCIFY